ncbi:MAG: bifunctional diguanylate cyclase/phosphodiesterase, partial [Microcystaceae cyanobacterium]
EFFNQLTHPEDLAKVLENLQTASQAPRDYTLEYRITTKQGQEKWVWEKGHGVFNEKGHFLGIEGFITDISHLKQMEAALRRSEANYRGIFEHCRHGIFQTTLDGFYLSANPALAHLYGYDSPQEMITTLTDLNHQLYIDPNRRQQFIQLLHQEDAVTNFQSQVYRRDGRIIWILENARAVRDDQGNLLHYEGIVEDITQHKQINEQLQFRAFNDALTGLPNRAYLMANLKAKIEAVQEDFKPFALFFLDLDRFKLVNDSLGHLVGDQLLKAIAGRLRYCLRSQDIIGRLGGDEFIIILDTLRSEQEAIHIAERIKQAFEKPFQLDHHQVYTGVSIGIVYLDETVKAELNAEDLLRDADTALYQAKDKNKGHFCLFNPTMHKTTVALFKQETELQTAFKEKQFCLHYQPIFTLLNQQVVGFEALVRWHHPVKGLVSPGYFIETCEDTGLIVPLGWWILEEACQQLVIWQSHYSIYQPLLSISVNLSVKQLLSSHLFEKIDYILLKTGLSGEFLKLEITETCYLSNNEQVLGILSEIKNRNIQICIDDFGKGYSSLGYLHQFPIDILKIDKVLVDYIDQDAPKCKVAKMILRLGQELGFEVVAEGIETASQFEALLTQGCRFGQGHYFSEPLAADLVDEFLALHPPVIC